MSLGDNILVVMCLSLIGMSAVLFGLEWNKVESLEKEIAKMELQNNAIKEQLDSQQKAILTILQNVDIQVKGVSK